MQMTQRSICWLGLELLVQNKDIMLWNCALSDPWRCCSRPLWGKVHHAKFMQIIAMGQMIFLITVMNMGVKGHICINMEAINEQHVCIMLNILSGPHDICHITIITITLLSPCIQHLKHVAKCICTNVSWARSETIVADSLQFNDVN